MAKRFTESDKWLDPWFVELSPSFKLAWLYLVDRCDPAGVIDLSPRIASSLIGDDTDWGAFVEATDGRVERLACGKWWLTRFVEFQYGGGPLKPNYNPHKAAVRSVRKYDLPVAIEGEDQPSANLHASLQQASSKLLDKDKDKDKDKATSKKRSSRSDEPPGFKEFYEAYPRKEARPVAARAFAKALDSLGDRDDPAGFLRSRAEAYAASDVGRGPNQFVKQPATWLNQQCYFDDDSVWRRDSDRGSPGNPKPTFRETEAAKFLARHEANDGNRELCAPAGEPDLRRLRAPDG